MKILLLSAYDAMSHRYWREGLVANLGHHDWTVLSLPPRHFNWRIRGSSLSWAFGERQLLGQSYDRVLATSMTDLSALRGMVPKLASVPSIVYFHENQFAYPSSSSQQTTLEPQIVNLYSALSADRVLFNSDYNRTTFINGVSQLLKKLPDYVPDNVPELLQERSQVVPVPLSDSLFVEHTEDDSKGSPLQIIWNHRWEYDKAPETLFMALSHLRRANVPFKVHVLGQQFRRMPEVFVKARSELESFIGSWGHIADDTEYRKILAAGDIVLSTAIHDFQGIAVLEAVAAGCQPLVPDRLAYRELFPHRFRYESCPEQPEKEAQILAGRLQVLAEAKSQGSFKRDVPDLNRLRWSYLGQSYDDALTAISL
ncbi:tRNA-queuosine alpha-mannosyltransferase domain-containing protein [Spongorhabdus nitratireducens]